MQVRYQAALHADFSNCKKILSCRLAFGAEVRAALPNQDALDGCATGCAWLIRLSIHLEIFLEVAAGIHPIKAGPVGANACEQNVLHGLVEAARIGLGEL